MSMRMGMINDDSDDIKNNSYDHYIPPRHSQWQFMYIFVAFNVIPSQLINLRSYLLGMDSR